MLTVLWLYYNKWRPGKGGGEALSPAKSVEGGSENNTNFVLKLQYNKDEELITIIHVTTLGNAYNWLSK